MSQYMKAVFCMVGSSVLFSFGGLFLKGIVWHPLATIGLRSLIAAICLYPLLKKPCIKQTKQTFYGAFFTCLKYVSYAIGIELTTATNSIMIQYTAPIFVIIINLLLYKEKPTKLEFRTVVAVFIGLIIFFIDDISFGNIVGNGFALISSIAYAGMAICLKKDSNPSSIAMMFWANVMITAVGLPFIIFEGLPDFKTTIIIMLAGIVILALPLVMMGYAAKFLSSVETILLSIMELVLTPLWVFIFLGEIPSIMAIIGAIIIVISITYKSFLEAKKNEY